MRTLEEILSPIPGDDPAGPSLRYEPVYDEIKEARREDEDLPQGDWEAPRKTADWPRVLELTSGALAERSKDLWLAAWLTEALLRVEGIAGLRKGLEVTLRLLQAFWEHIHPEIEDGDAEMRAAPLGYIGVGLDGAVRMAPLSRSGHDLLQYRASSKVPTEAEARDDSEKQTQRERAVSEGRLTPEEFESGFASTPKAWYKAHAADLAGCLETLGELEAFGDERFGLEAAPGYKQLKEALAEVGRAGRELLQRKLELEPDPVSVEEDMVHDGGGLRAAEARSEAGPPTTRRAAEERVAECARFMRAEDPTDPGPYLMLRGLRWGELRAGGGGPDPKLLAAPPTATRTRLKTLLLDEQWSDLLEAAEEVMATPFGRGWLDLQRYTFTALGALGGPYEGVLQGIRGALAALLRDLPGLVDATLMDDTPTANRETLEWLGAEGFGTEESAEPRAAKPGPRARPGGALDGLLDRSRQLVRSGQPERGIQLLMDAVEREQNERSRFLLRSHAAGIMVDAGLESVALPVLQDVHEQINQSQDLLEWEGGEVVAHPLGLLYRCIQRLEGRSDEELYQRICRLDPMMAIELQRSGNDGAGASSDGDSG